MSHLEFRPGDIFFTINKGNWISRTMAWFMRSRWSHAGIIAEQGALRTWTIETSDFEVCSSTLEQILNNPQAEIEIWRIRGMTDDQRVLAVTAALSLDNKLYGYLQLFSFAVRCLLKRVGVNVDHFIRSGWVCNQVVTYALVEAGNDAFSLEEIKALDTEEVYQRLRTRADLIHFK